MTELTFDVAIELALEQAMADDPTIVILGEDVHTLRRNLYARFGESRVRPTPISEAAFLGAAVSASMAELRPVAEIMLVDFIAVAIDALMNHAAKIETFTGGRWTAPVTVRAACGAGYGDGGQHGQSLWGWLAHIPGLAVCVPSTPEDAGRLMLSAIEHNAPTVFLEHKLLSDTWLDYMGGNSRDTVAFDVPLAGRFGDVPEHWTPLPVGKSVTRRNGSDLTLASVGVGVHRCLEAADRLADRGVETAVIDLRWVAPLDLQALAESTAKTRRLIVVDEDYEACGLSGEIAGALLADGLQFAYDRVCTQTTIPFARDREDQALPSCDRILDASDRVLNRTVR